MSDFFFFALLGVGPGAIIGLLAVGLVVVYRGTGVLNLAHAAQASLGAYLYYTLSSWGMPTLVAVLVAAVATGVAGLAIEFAVMRPLTNASPLTQLIASTAVLGVIQSTLLLVYGSDARNAKTMLPADPVGLWDDRFVGGDRLLLLVVGVVITVVLWAFFKYSTFGITTTAAAANPMGAATLGINANRVSVTTWFIGGTLAGLAGALTAPLSGLSLLSFVGLLVPVLAAALGGGLVSIPLAMILGVFIGVAQSTVSSYSDARGVSTMVTFAILVVLMLLRGQSVVSRGVVGTKLPSVGSGLIRPLPTVGILASLVVLVWAGFSPEWNQALLTSSLIVLPLLSVVVVTGYAGQLSLAQFSMAGIGAVVAAQLASRYDMPFPLLLLLGGLAALPAGYLLALTAQRMRGASLAILTLGFNILLFAVLFSRSEVIVVPPPSFFGIDLSALIDPRAYITFALVMITLTLVLVGNARRGQFGRHLLAIRGNERAAASLGISVRSAKTKAFLLSSFIAAVGGVLLTFRSTAVSSTNFAPLESIYQLGWVVIGGVGYLVGPLVGSIFAPGGLGNQLIATIYNDQFAWLPLVSSLLLLITILLNPDGVVSVFRDLGTLVRARLQRPRKSDAFVLPAAAPQQTVRARSTLRIDSVSKAFGGSRVLTDVSLTVAAGTVHGLIGPNGAGKTTLLDVISGFTKPDKGELLLGGRTLTRLSPEKRARAGIGRSFQNLELFDDMTVYDNILVASEISRRPSVLRDLFLPRRAELSASAIEAIRFLELEAHLQHKISDLTYGTRHLVAIARALATDADVVLLDEPAAGLDEVETAELKALIRRLVENAGLAVLLIEHDVDLVMSVSDRVTALRGGEVVASGTPDEVRSDPAVIESYLGTSDEAEKKEVTG
ncbi:ABC transporter permease subunit [Specibacter sp. RAF43]|uniref:ABC transporter permease subunit n=1 Tax=Specibacter sp. RAF43 TaxID=3233057 RepID=UPI003F98BC7F